MNDDRIDELVQELVDARRIPRHETEFLELQRIGYYQQLSRSVFMANAQWQELLAHEREFARCYAASMQSTKAVLVGRSAALMGNLWVMPAKDPDVELALPSGAPPGKSFWFPGHQNRHAAIPEDQIVEAGGIRYTDSMRTAIDIARFRGFREGVVAFDSLLAGHDRESARLIWQELVRMLDWLSGGRGLPDARRALKHATNLSESPYESWVRTVLIEHGIPCQPQMCVGKYRGDLLIDAQLFTEIDGHSKYEDVPHKTVIKQLKRENALKAKGYEFMRLFTDEAYYEEARWLRELEEARRRAAARGPVSEAAVKYVPRGPGRHTPNWRAG